MPTMEPETIGGISIGITLYSVRFCVPPYSHNSDIAAPYMSVHANNARGSEIAGDEMYGGNMIVLQLNMPCWSTANGYLSFLIHTTANSAESLYNLDLQHGLL